MLIIRLWKCIQSAEKLHAQTSWGDGRDQNKDLLLSNYVLDMCSAMDHQSGSDQGWKSSSTTEVFWRKVFHTNLLQCPNILPPTSIHSWWRWGRDWHVIQSARLLLDGCCCLSDTGSKILFRINFLATNYDCWIAQGGPVAWPPRLLDLTPMDFFLWGHI
jgi:hypothetical protein